MLTKAKDTIIKSPGKYWIRREKIKIHFRVKKKEQKILKL